MKKFTMLLSLGLSLSAQATTYVTANIENISTDYALTKAGLVLKLINADYPACNNTYTKFYLSDFESQSIDHDDAKDRLAFARSLALSAMMANKKIQFILKSDTGGTCTATGWLKINNN